MEFNLRKIILDVQDFKQAICNEYEKSLSSAKLSDGKQIEVLDVRGLAKRLNVSVLEKDSLPLGVSGMVESPVKIDSLKDLSSVTISVDKSDSTFRKNFTVAHEFGHLYYAFLNKSILSSQRSLEELDPMEERIMDEFAGNLLMPSDSIREAQVNYHELSETYKVTPSAMQVRMERLKRFGEYSH